MADRKGNERHAPVLEHNWTDKTGAPCSVRATAFYADVAATPEQVADEILRLAAELAAVKAENLKWEEREAAVCPEDFGFEEYIRCLEKEVNALKAERDEAMCLLEQGIFSRLKGAGNETGLPEFNALSARIEAREKEGANHG